MEQLYQRKGKETEMKLSFEGAMEEEYTEPIIFQNRKKIYEEKNVLEILLKYHINMDLAKRISSMGVKVLFPKEISKNLSFHLFTSNAIYIDGINRICRMSVPMGKPIIVEEFRGSRTSPYSAWYLILAKKLEDKGIIAEKAIFHLKQEEVKIFLDCIDEINKESLSGNYELLAGSKKHTLAFQNKTFYYNVAYWRKKEDMDIENNEFHLNPIEEIRTLIADGSATDLIQNKDKIDAFFTRVNTYFEFYEKRMAFISEGKHMENNHI